MAAVVVGVVKQCCSIYRTPNDGHLASHHNLGGFPRSPLPPLASASADSAQHKISKASSTLLVVHQSKCSAMHVLGIRTRFTAESGCQNSFYALRVETEG